MKCHLRWSLPESMCEILALVVLEPVLLVLSFWVYDVIYYYVVYFLKELMNGISETWTQIQVLLLPGSSVILE